MWRRRIAALLLGLAIVSLNAGADCEADIDVDKTAAATSHVQSAD